MNDNSLRVTIDAPGFLDPSLQARLAVIVENALLAEFAKLPEQAKEESSVQITAIDSSRTQLVETNRRVYLGDLDILDPRPLQVEIILL